MYEFKLTVIVFKLLSTTTKIQLYDSINVFNVRSNIIVDISGNNNNNNNKNLISVENRSFPTL